MLTCHDVLEVLPGLEAGEHASGEVHDHLASCEACRAEALQVRTDLARLRGDLATLSPSPFLEERVLEAARASEPVSSSPRSSLRWGMVAGLAAAIVLAGVLIMANRAPDPEAGVAVETQGSKTVAGEGEPDTGPSQVEVPATAMQVAGQRRKRYPLGSESQRLLTLAGAPPKGIALLGQDLLARFLPDGMISLSDGLEKAERRLTKGGTQPFIRVWVSNPQTGATALVRALVSRRYTGSLLLEEPLARALGLEQHELPGHVTIAGDLKAKAYRTRARLRMTRLDAIVEIQTLREHHPPAADIVPAGHKETGSRLELLGEHPDAAMVAAKLARRGDRFEMESSRVTTFGEKARTPAVLSIEQSTPSILLHYRKKDGNAGCVVILPALDFGAGGPWIWRMTMRRVTLAQRFEPGTAIAIARVWRGATAIPSRESVAFTKADAKGVVSFVRTGRERGPLRLRERRKDGTVHWHTLDLDGTPDLVPTLDVHLTKAGVIRIGARTFGPVPKKSQQFGWRWDAPAVAELRKHLAGLADRAGRAAPHGTARLTMVVHAEPGTPWTAVEFVILVCAIPDVRIDKLRFEGAGRAVPYELPKDRGLAPAPPAKDDRWRQAKITITTKTGSTYWRGLRLEKTLPLNGDGEWGHLMGRLRTYAREARSNQAEPSLELRPWPDVPYADVRRVIAAAQAAGIEDVRLRSSPPR